MIQLIINIRKPKEGFCNEITSEKQAAQSLKEIIEKEKGFNWIDGNEGTYICIGRISIKKK